MISRTMLQWVRIRIGGAVTRGSEGRLFEIINSTAFNTMALRPEINDIDDYDPQRGAQKPLVNAIRFLEV